MKDTTSRWVEYAKADLHYLQPRYPDLPFAPSFSFTYNRKNTKRLLKQTSDIFLWLEKELLSNK